MYTHRVIRLTAHAYRKCMKTTMAIVRSVQNCGILAQKASRRLPSVTSSKSTVVAATSRDVEMRGGRGSG